MLLLFIWLVAVAIVVWLLREPLRVEHRRRGIRRQPFPAAWRAILRRRVPYVALMPADLQLQLKKHIQVFLAEKTFTGCAGLVIDDEIRVAIAAQACLLILNRRAGCFDGLREILVYPDAFIVGKQRADPAGVSHESRDVLAGESWSRGQVVLSWNAAVEGARIADDGGNVVIHEFAHQLDQENGPANGAPRLAGSARRARWAEVMGREFAELQQRVRNHRHSVLDAYGASDPAEFFAVASEAFFEQPSRLAAEHGALYAQLSSFYRVDPLSW